MPPEATVFLVDDNADVRESMSLFLDTCGLPVRAFSSAREFLAAQPIDGKGCLVLDIGMPGMTGLELQRELQARGCDLPVIVFSGHDDVHLAVEAMKNGAVDFLQKPIDHGKLLACIQRALELSRQHEDEREQSFRVRAQLATLTARESEVLRYLVGGDMSKCIAHKLGISPRTVELHRARVMKKLGCRNLAQLLQKMKASDQHSSL